MGLYIPRLACLQNSCDKNKENNPTHTCTLRQLWGASREDSKTPFYWRFREWHQDHLQRTDQRASVGRTQRGLFRAWQHLALPPPHQSWRAAFCPPKIPSLTRPLFCLFFLKKTPFCISPHFWAVNSESQELRLRLRDFTLPFLCVRYPLLKLEQSFSFGAGTCPASQTWSPVWRLSPSKVCGSDVPSLSP